MGIPVLILGESGSGKSASLRNFKPDEIGVINVNGKPFPFRNQLRSISTDNYQKITNILNKTESKTIIIDDSQYLMVNEFMRMAKLNGYQKFTEIALNFWNLINTVTALPDDRIVYFLHHIDTTDDGVQRIKTVGKLLNEKITLEGMFTIVMKTSVHDGRYYFTTQNSGYDTVKTPIGLFDSEEIDNDLKAVDTAIRKYYEIGA